MRSLTNPTTSDLRSAFEAVGTGHLPSDYPSTGGEGLVPTTLLEAVAWEESKWRQYDSFNQPLVSSDGGYGIMQVTSGMGPGQLSCRPSRLPSPTTCSITSATAPSSLMQKLHLTPTIGDGEPSVLEHWYYALWAYNAWGWTNNPTNPQFTRDGTPDSHPWAYPYQERVFYYVSHPPRGRTGSHCGRLFPSTYRRPRKLAPVRAHCRKSPTPHVDPVPASPAAALTEERSARFLADVTIPDGTVLHEGQHFTKAWQLENDGTVPWESGFRLMPAGGSDLGSQAGIPIGTTPPLAIVTVSTELLAQSAPGMYREYWQMVDRYGRPFGTRVWVSVVVDDAAPVPTRTAATSASGSATPMDEDGSGSLTPLVTGKTTPLGIGVLSKVSSTVTPEAVISSRATSTAEDLAESANDVTRHAASPALKLSRASDIQSVGDRRERRRVGVRGRCHRSRTARFLHLESTLSRPGEAQKRRHDDVEAQAIPGAFRPEP